MEKQESINDSSNECEDTWEKIKLPEYMKDLSYDFKSDQKSFVDFIIERNFLIDISNKQIFEEIKKRNLRDEYRVLQDVIDYNDVFENRLFNTNEWNKNRYTDILPYKDNRVQIGKNGFINASYIHTPFRNAFIASQGPLEETYQDFWQMIWENNCRIILMMCEVTENKQNKCYLYWPKFSATKILNELSFENGLKIKPLSEKNLTENLTERNFSITNTNNNENREVIQLHFRSWPDHGVPDLLNSYETFDIINSFLLTHYEKFKSNSPVLAHCSAGVGRTGSIISIFQINYIIKKQLEKKNKILNLNVFNIVRQLKEQRRYMVQTSSQYELIHTYLNFFLKKLLQK